MVQSCVGARTEQRVNSSTHVVRTRSAATVQFVRMAALKARVHGRVDLNPEQLAAARDARNGSCSALLVTLGRSDADAAVLGELSVAAVWRLRGVSRAFRGWCGSALAAIPRVVAVGGMQIIGGVLHVEQFAPAISLDLATLAWGGGGTVPDPPAPCMGCSLGQLLGGRLVAIGGSFEFTDGDGATAGTFEWVPGHAAWTPLPPMGGPRAYAAVAVLSDGRMLVASGYDGNVSLASAEVLAADGSGWAALPPMAAARYGAAMGRLPGGQFIVAGGSSGDNELALASAELWDPATGTWAALPPMAQPRRFAADCVLPSGRFAVLGGHGGGNVRMNAEAFDPVSQAWQPFFRPWRTAW